MVFVREDGYSFAKPCICRLEKTRRKRLAAIPPMFSEITLESLRPDIRKHAGQANAVKLIKESPSANYFLAGRFGTGKTLFLWTLYREAVMQDKRVIVCTLSELLNEYRAFIQASMNGGEAVYPRISAGDLRQNHTRYSIFIDDIDKARPSEYAAEQLFELSDAIYAYDHQVVVTTNLTLAKLVEHFERADERFGGAIVRRLVEKAHRIEMF